MANPAANPELYGRPKPKNSIPANLSSTSAVALSSELARLAASGKTQGRKRPATSSKDDIFRKGSNRGVSNRAARDVVDCGSSRKTTSREIGYLDDAELQRSKKMMEEKTRLYNAMKRGDYLPPTKKFKGGWTGAEEDRAGGLIDFDRKWAEREANKEEEDAETSSDDDLSVRSGDEDIVEHEDEFGRTRKLTKRELRKVQREDARANNISNAYDSDEDVRRRRVDPSQLIYGDTIQTAAFDQDEFERRRKQMEEEERDLQDTHYDATKEVRTKGVGFYQFSQDSEVRKKEMEALKTERDKTEKEQKAKETRKEERRKEVERRREELKKRRQGKQGERWLQNFLDETPELLAKSNVEEKPESED
ncbi:hypothetical protein H072_5912 [Dactylellina haptotyla CBS 200.50]|uniref:Uncharacterized protein n=1 Tax=Dactylellina haptotyla (strain CBS 200.50) TaxID=1284197 RepID=S8BY58_DACHA|nr:hypothetical protein H072_5912 [Dactylellina haptotyla CBS 200.50]